MTLIRITQPPAARSAASACDERKAELQLRIARCEKTMRECESYMQGDGRDKIGALQGWMDNLCAVLDYRDLIEQIQRRAAWKPHYLLVITSAL